MNEILKKVRTAKGYSQLEFSKLVAMDQTTYSRKETGKTFITEQEWDRFAKTLGVSKEEIKDKIAPQAINENCIFNDQSVGIQNISLPVEVLETILRYNKKLEEENALLKTKKQPLKNNINKDK
jgi:transcriptional regulator with XRE-family HTH domain